MAFPLLFEENFELGTLGAFNSETDTQPKLDYPHYSALAPLGLEPWRGAYCMRADLAVGTTEAYVEELEGFDVAANTAAAMRMYLRVSGLVSADTDTFDLFRWQSAGPANEFSIRILNTSGVLTIEGGNPDGGGTFRSTALPQNRWFPVELVINTGTGVNATCAFYVDGYQVGATITGITCAALTQARVGVLGIDAGTTAGIILYDDIIVDDARVYPVRERYPVTIPVTKSGHITVGPGQVGSIALVSGGTDNVCTLYDTDEAVLADASNVIGQIASGVSGESVSQVLHSGDHKAGYFARGCYVNLTGTNPRAVVALHDGLHNPSQVRRQGLRRKAVVI